MLFRSPNKAGTYSFTATATDGLGLTTSRTYTVNVASALPAVSTASLAGGTTGIAYSATLAGTGGVTPYTWSVVSGSLPPGLALSSSGALSGKPTAVGTFPFTVGLTDVDGRTASKALSIAVIAPLTVVTSSMPPATTAVAYSVTLAASGGSGTYTWSMASGTLPAGLTLSSAGLLSGTPTSAGSFSFSVKVTDGAARTATKSLTVEIGRAHV